MLRIVFIISLLPVLAAMFAAWWYGARVLAMWGGTRCRMDAGRWQRIFGEDAVAPGDDVSAAVLAREIHRRGVVQWKRDDPRAAAARAGAKRFGMAVPPLAVMVLALGVLAGRVPVFGALAGVVAAVALAAAFLILSVGAELSMVLVLVRKLQDQRLFVRSDDERAVAECLTAWVWEDSLPPVLRLLTRSQG
jgi:hypothetical protein